MQSLQVVKAPGYPGARQTCHFSDTQQEYFFWNSKVPFPGCYKAPWWLWLVLVGLLLFLFFPIIITQGFFCFVKHRFSPLPNLQKQGNHYIEKSKRALPGQMDSGYGQKWEVKPLCMWLAYEMAEGIAKRGMRNLAESTGKFATLTSISPFVGFFRGGIVWVGFFFPWQFLLKGKFNTTPSKLLPTSLSPQQPAKGWEECGVKSTRFLES